MLRGTTFFPIPKQDWLLNKITDLIRPRLLGLLAFSRKKLMGDILMFLLGNLSANDFPLLKQDGIVLFPVFALVFKLYSYTTQKRGLTSIRIAKLFIFYTICIFSRNKLGVLNILK
ncbi:hypothetical protein BABA_18312 [Neobacillus bataviensis LMG 21833]|uniref:Uncharacterized protein n=1 Tax=Neobacillus bataviensis LMG 21833 TaxID=1117379 RepID=K6C401_9BACI|nr:hypothetical protein BABA_18312 [Neobacillus bataviensis LMG 21833]